MTDEWHTIPGSWKWVAGLEVQQYGTTNRRRVVRLDGKAYMECSVKKEIRRQENDTRS